MCTPDSAKDLNIYISNIDTGIHTTVHKYVCTKLLKMQQKLFVAYITTLEMHVDS